MIQEAIYKEKVMDMIENIKEQFRIRQSNGGSEQLKPFEQKAFDDFNKMGIPTVRHEEWKYTRIGSLFNKSFEIAAGSAANILPGEDLDEYRLPGHENANQLVFVNGLYSQSLSSILSNSLIVCPLEKAAENE